MTIPGLSRRSRNATKRRSRLPFHLRASDMVENGLTALSGQDATFTRASAGGLVLDRNGRLIGPHANVLPRYQMHDLDGDGVRESPALLLEAQRTNLVDDQDIENGWTNTATVTQTDAGPDGKDSGYSVDDDDAGADETSSLTVGFTGDAVKAVACWVKEGTSGEARVRIRDTTAGADHLDMRVTSFDASTGEPTVTESTGSLLGKVRGRDGWWRLLCQTTSVTAANTNSMLLHGAIGAAQTGSALYALPQAEDAAVPSSDITTSGSTVSRSAELLQYSIGWTPADIERSGGLTILSEMVELGTAFAGAAGPRYWQFGGSGASSTPYLLLRAGAADGRVEALWDDGSGALVSNVNSAVTMLDRAWVRVTVALNGSDWELQCHVSTDGETETSSTADTIGSSLPAAWSAGTLTIGAAPDGSNNGLASHLAHKAAFGDRTLAQMRSAF